VSNGYDAKRLFCSKYAHVFNGLQGQHFSGPTMSMKQGAILKAGAARTSEANRVPLYRCDVSLREGGCFACGVKGVANMTTAKILATVAALVSLPSLALAQTVVIVTSPYSGGYAQPSAGGYAQPYSGGYAQPYYGGYSYGRPYSGYYAYAPAYSGYVPGYVYGWQRW
jgi:hypothetical protein